MHSFLVVVLLILAVSAYDPGIVSKPWHALQQVSTNGSSFVSVDADGNIDLLKNLII